MNWKRHERKTAEALGGKRISRGMDFGQSLPDVEHPVLSIECKYRARISGFLKDGLRQAQKYDRSKIPTLVVKEKGMRGGLVVMRLCDFQDLFGNIFLKGESHDEQ